jgi:uncharacterized protein (TIGR03437 family)
MVLVLAAFGQAQTSADSQPDWRKIGGPAVDLSLAAPATGRVAQVWYSPSGSKLFARTQSGNTFETADFETWTPAASPDPAPAPEAAVAVRLPEEDARVISLAVDRNHIFALGRQISRSSDGGRSWMSLTGLHGRSVIGPGQHSIAVSPLDSNQIAVANDYGVWRSVDGGLTWCGLNTSLPNLHVQRIWATPGSAGGTRAQVDGLGELELPPGGTIWRPTAMTEIASDSALRLRYSAALGAEIRAVAVSGDMIYAGAADGRIWVSNDGGRTFGSLPWAASGPVERIYADPVQPNVAVAAIAGNGPHVLRTVNNGGFWDALDSSSLPNSPAHGIAADRASGAIYVATDKGVFYGRADLESASTAPVAWQNLTANLPAAPATDVKLDPAGVQLYIALDGYGVYAAAAPHSRRSLRIVDAADNTVRPAAPGSLLSIIGARVNSASDGSLTYPVLSAADAESQIQVPFGVGGPGVNLALETASGRLTAQLAVQPASPAILVNRDGVPVLLDADTNLPLDLRNPAHSNGRVLVMATGLGKVKPDWPAGVPAPMTGSPAVVANVKASLDGAPVQVTRAELAGGYVGFYVVELQLPSITNAGTSELHLTVEGQDSNKVQIYIEP